MKAFARISISVLRKTAFLEAALPQRCVICGTLAGDVLWRPAPLCAVCESGLDAILGRRCGKCGRSLISEDELCMECRETNADDLKIHPLFMYRGSVAALMHHYKTQGRRSLAAYFAFRLSPLIDSLCSSAGLDRREIVLVPVPPRPEKIRAGKGDQVGILASALSRVGFQSARALVRRANSPQQKTLARAERLKNAATAYALASSAVPPRVILLDDVATTGATLRACAAILRQAGAEVVAAVAMAAD